MLIRIVTFHNANIPTEVLNAQAAVFSKFGHPIEQTLTNLNHGPSIDRFLRTEHFDVLLLFDVDCIPLNAEVIPEAIELVADHYRVYGARQNSNSFAGGDYIAPSFMCFSRRTFQALGSPSFCSVKRRADVGAQMTYRAQNPGFVGSLLNSPRVEVRFLEVSDVAVPKWSFSNGTRFGLGTTYENKIFHAFGGSSELLCRRLFLEKAAEVLGKRPEVVGTAPAPTGTTQLPGSAAPEIPVYVISLPDARERRLVMDEQLRRSGLRFRFIDAVDGRSGTAPDAADGVPIVPGAFSSSREAGRAASHRLAHRAVAAGNADLALVLEDDAKLPEKFVELLASLSRLDFDVLKLEGGDYDSRRAVVTRLPGFSVIVRRVPSRGSAAYLIRKVAAARLCALPSIDQSMSDAFNDFRLWLRVLELQPFAVVQEGERQRYTWLGPPRPSKLVKWSRAIKWRYRLVRLYGLGIAASIELQRLQSSFDPD